MNIIQQHAKDFAEANLEDVELNYRNFIENFRSMLYEYKKQSHKVEFANELLRIAKINFDKNYSKCKPEDRENNIGITYYESIIFFMQNEFDELLESLSNSDFNFLERKKINDGLSKILEELNLLKLGQELTYDDFKEEFEELKNLYYLNKKNWSQLFIGKISEMVASGIISETLSKGIIKSVNAHYGELI